MAVSQLRPISDFKHSATSLAPPVTTRHQVLPFDQLQWEAFEALCLRLVESDAQPEFCRFYGERGDAQEGIDFFAKRVGTDLYGVYQCKKVKEFGPADIRQAVDLFLKGDFATRAETLVLCAALPLRRKKLTDEIESARRTLRAKGVAFEVWDADTLSTRLKSRSGLVADFFGEAWVDAFCGADEPITVPFWSRSRTRIVAGVAAVVAVVVGAIGYARHLEAAAPSQWLKFETMSVYRVIPDPEPADGGRDAFVGVVLEVKNLSDERSFDVEDLFYEGPIGFEPIGPGGIISQVEGFGQPARIVGGGILGPHSRTTVVIVFPFLHRDTSLSPTGGVMPVFSGRWTLVVDGLPVPVTASYKSEGSVFRSRWDTVVEAPDLKLKPMLHKSTIPDPWRRRGSE